MSLSRTTMVQYLRKLIPKNRSQCFKNYSTETSNVRTIPSPKQWSPTLHSLSVLRKSRFGKQLHKYIDDLHREHGPIFRETLGPVNAVFISDPNEMRRVFGHEGKYPVHILLESWLLFNQINNYQRGLYFMNGEEWLQYRKLLNPLLLKNYDGQRILEWCGPMVNQLIDEWFAISDNGEILHLETQLYELSILFMLAVTVGSSFPNHLQEVRTLTGILATNLRNIFKESVTLSQIPAKVAAQLRLPAWKRFTEAVQASFDISKLIMKTVEPIASSDGLIYQFKQCNVPAEKVSTIVLDFILAAGDTTAITTQWGLYLLAIHEDIQNAVAAEFQNCDLVKTCESDLMRGILRETLRLFPVAPFITRILPEDLKVFDSYVIPAKELIILSVYSSGYNESYFPEACKFIPDRWKRDEQTGLLQGVIDPFATLPYAMGARSCIGRKIAQSQICFTLATIFRQYEVLIFEPVDMILHLIPVPNKPVRLHFEPRTRR